MTCHAYPIQERLRKRFSAAGWGAAPPPAVTGRPGIDGPFHLIAALSDFLPSIPPSRDVQARSAPYGCRMATATRRDTSTEDPPVLASVGQTVLEELGEACGCAEPGCSNIATPDGQPLIAGRDDIGMAVRLRKWRCEAGRWYHLEVR